MNGMPKRPWVRAVFPALIFLFLCVPALSVSYFGPQISVVIDGRRLPLERPPIVSHKRVLVPFRNLFEKLGAAVNYAYATRTITAARGAMSVMLTVGSNQA